MKFFDIVFYWVYKFYNQHKERGAESTAAGIVGGLQVVNIMTILMIISIIFHNKNYFLDKLTILILFIFFQITTYIRYIYKDNNSIKIIEEKWLANTHINKEQSKYYVTIYILFSIVLLFGLAIYLGTKEY